GGTVGEGAVAGVLTGGWTALKPSRPAIPPGPRYRSIHSLPFPDSYRNRSNDSLKQQFHASSINCIIESKSETI
ncbi:hypothetical protein K6W80_25285, partial [Burkholderia contaminans]|uniref:hypothetical protein n=1 Tax=Burkholderia contaminans TaxID=488447 RepID=UPI001C93F883